MPIYTWQNESGDVVTVLRAFEEIDTPPTWYELESVDLPHDTPYKRIISSSVVNSRPIVGNKGNW
jgi:hypothetical protein